MRWRKALKIFSASVEEHFLIIADGQTDFADAEQLRALRAGRVLIALDGAANFLRGKDIAPDLAIGDFDSISRGTRAFLEERGTEFLFCADQNTTDLEKALIYLGEKGCASVRVLHGLGGRLDHALGNVTFLKKYAKVVPNLSLTTERGQIFYWEDAHIALCAPAGAHCGFFGFPLAHISADGLRYGMDRYRVELGVSESVANSFLGGEAHLTIAGWGLAAMDRSVQLIGQRKIGE
ncbi:MAG: thiamine diphosphokinase [Puniceicoccales bacterium]|jgi:thiamine pyrophosphokinase|nr:thiamine diphosphokinase [Puniceicoccales bacterium]